MVLGLSLHAFTVVHVILSLIGIAAGLVVLGGMVGGRRLEGWTAVFLVTTILTSVTGFFFPFTRIGPPHVLGVMSLVVLAVTLVALYGQRLRGAWRWLYVVGSLVALYLNVVVGVVQAFQKLPFLTLLAPTQSEPPFLVAQVLVLVTFLVLGIRAVARFRPTAPAPA
jgi:hypothetical protein